MRAECASDHSKMQRLVSSDAKTVREYLLPYFWTLLCDGRAWPGTWIRGIVLVKMRIGTCSCANVKAVKGIERISIIRDER